MNQQCKDSELALNPSQSSEPAVQKKIVESVKNINIHKALLSTHSKPSNAVHVSSVTQLRQKGVVSNDGSNTVKLAHVPFYNTIGYGPSLGMDCQLGMVRHWVWFVTGMARHWALIITGYGSSFASSINWVWVVTGMARRWHGSPLGHGLSLGMDLHSLASCYAVQWNLNNVAS